MRETIFCVCMCVHVYVLLQSSIYGTLKVTLYPRLPETYTSEISSFSHVMLLYLIYHIFLKIRSELFPNSSSEKWRRSPFNIVLYKYFHQHTPFFLLGSMSPTERTVAWEKKRVFFLTPQVFTNDLTCGACAAASIKCLVVDEAHRALGNHSYCQVSMSMYV